MSSSPDFSPELALEQTPDLSSPASRYVFLEKLHTTVDYAYQPIVNVHTGTTFGFEALVRGQELLGFEHIHDLFDHAHQKGFLAALDLTLRGRAVEKFARLPYMGRVQLFLNLDPRAVRAPTTCHERMAKLLAKYGLSPNRVIIELSEVWDMHAEDGAREAVRLFRERGFGLAIDDFGAGFSGLKLLYDQQPEFLKIDRFFVSEIPGDHKKKLFVANAVNLAHVLGIKVIAEGVETEAEFLTCKEIGCDLVQGYFVARPTTELSELEFRYAEIESLSRKDRRAPQSDRDLIRHLLERPPAVRIDAPVNTLFDRFRDDRARSYLPVVDEGDRPLGLVFESSIKSYVYSTYGRDLLANKAYRKSMDDFLSPCPIVDIGSSVERILEMYTNNANPAGIIITDDFAYAGFLTADSLLRVIEQKNLAHARDQNPLTRLPGNNAIVSFVAHALEEVSAEWTLVYLDFDHFKPFNDSYGFRRGDRAILLFAELMQKSLIADGCFMGHIGGDDFFLGFRDEVPEVTRERVSTLIARFENDVASLYDPPARARGCLTARDRNDDLQEFPLLSCSAAIVHIPAGPRCLTAEELAGLIGELKQEAKRSEDRLRVYTCAPFVDGARESDAP